MACAICVILTMIIYKITNKVNGKIYIGLTKNSLKDRWRGHLNRAKNNSERNVYLYNSINFYGKENFSIEKIDVAESNFELNEKEKYWAEYYNSYAPNGMNIALCGNNAKKSKESILKIAKHYKLFSPLNELYQIHNLSDFCIEQGLDKCHMYKVATGKRDAHKGWSLKKKEMIFIFDRYHQSILVVPKRVGRNTCLLDYLNLDAEKNSCISQFFSGRIKFLFKRFFLIDEFFCPIFAKNISIEERDIITSAKKILLEIKDIKK